MFRGRLLSHSPHPLKSEGPADGSIGTIMDKTAAPCLPAKATAPRTLHPGHCDLHVGLSERPQIDHGFFELKPVALVGDWLSFR